MVNRRYFNSNYEFKNSNRIRQTESIFFEFRLYCFGKKGRSLKSTLEIN